MASGVAYIHLNMCKKITLSIGQKAFTADLRLNYEKYYYDEGATIKPSEHDKVVAELMVRF